MSRETFQSLRMLLMEKLDLARELTDEEILEEIDTLILELSLIHISEPTRRS